MSSHFLSPSEEDLTAISENEEDDDPYIEVDSPVVVEEKRVKGKRFIPKKSSWFLCFIYGTLIFLSAILTVLFIIFAVLSIIKYTKYETPHFEQYYELKIHTKKDCEYNIRSNELCLEADIEKIWIPNLSLDYFFSPPISGHPLSDSWINEYTASSPIDFDDIVTPYQPFFEAEEEDVKEEKVEEIEEEKHLPPPEEPIEEEKPVEEFEEIEEEKPLPPEEPIEEEKPEEEVICQPCEVEETKEEEPEEEEKVEELPFCEPCEEPSKEETTIFIDRTNPDCDIMVLKPVKRYSWEGFKGELRYIFSKKTNREYGCYYTCLNEETKQRFEFYTILEAKSDKFAFTFCFGEGIQECPKGSVPVSIRVEKMGIVGEEEEEEVEE